MNKSEKLAYLLYHSTLPRVVQKTWLKLIPSMSQHELFMLLNILEKDNSSTESLEEEFDRFLLKQIVLADKFKHEITKELK